MCAASHGLSCAGPLHVLQETVINHVCRGHCIDEFSSVNEGCSKIHSQMPSDIGDANDLQAHLLSSVC